MKEVDYNIWEDPDPWNMGIDSTQDFQEDSEDPDDDPEDIEL